MEINLDTLEIEIVDTEAIDGGVQVFARAWSDGVQIGFGKDGSVDIERFRIINPPILVPDENGDILKVQEANASLGTSRSEQRFREDPEEALLQVIEQNLSAMNNIHTDEKIISGKRGNTTSTFYPDADPESTSVDGWVRNETPTAGWDSVHDSTNGTLADDTGSNDLFVRVQRLGDVNSYDLIRVFTLFDTSSIPDTDNITSATVSLYVKGVSDGDNDAQGYITVVQSSPASNTGLVTADFDQCGAVNNPTEGTNDRKDLSTDFTTSAYNDWALNATGIGWISKTGVTKLGFREGHDVEDLPLSANNQLNEIQASNAEASGTTQDPKLVVEHEAGGAEQNSNFLMFMS